MVSPERASGHAALVFGCLFGAPRSQEMKLNAESITPDPADFLTSPALSATLVMDNLLHDVPE
jgi:hypothetical protein